MYDYNVISTEKWINDEMDAAETACYRIAEINGLTKEQAENCESGKFNCCGCPWGGIELVNIGE